MNNTNPMIFIRARCDETWSGFTQGLTEDEPRKFESQTELVRKIYEHYTQSKSDVNEKVDFKASAHYAGRTIYALYGGYIGFWVEIVGCYGNVLRGRIYHKGRSISFASENELTRIVEKEFREIMSKQHTRSFYNKVV